MPKKGPASRHRVMPHGAAEVLPMPAGQSGQEAPRISGSGPSRVFGLTEARQRIHPAQIPFLATLEEWFRGGKFR